MAYDHAKYVVSRMYAFPKSSFASRTFTGTNETFNEALGSSRVKFFKDIKIMAIKARIGAAPPNVSTGDTTDHQFTIGISDGTTEIVSVALTNGTTADAWATGVVTTPVSVDADEELSLRGIVTFDGTLVTFTCGDQYVFIEYMERFS